VTTIPVSCPPDQWVQDLIDNQVGTGPPDVQSPQQSPLNSPGANQHAGTMPPNTRSDVLKLVTFNILHATGGHGDDWDPSDPGPPPRWVSDIQRVIAWADPDAICLQEASTAKSDITQAFGANWTFSCYTGTGPQMQNPIMFRKGRWKDIGAGSFIFGSAAGAGSKPTEKWVSQITATHGTSGQRVRLFNMAFPSHIDDDGTPYDLPRQDLYRQCMDALVHGVRSTPDTMLCFVLSDTEINYRNPRSRQVTWWPPKALAGLQMVANWYYAKTIPAYGTHGDRGWHAVYDHVYHRRTPQVQWSANGILKGLASDHNAVKAVYRVTRHATATDSAGNPNPGGSNSPNQGTHDDHQQQSNLNLNQPVDLDLLVCANLNFAYSDIEHQKRIDEITGVRGAAVVCLQELVARDTQPRWVTTQPTQPSGDPAGQAVLVRNDLTTSVTGSVRASTMNVSGIQARYFPWADIKLTFLPQRIRVVSLHMPPQRMPQYLKDDYGATLRAFLKTSPHPWVVGGDWNIQLSRDPFNMHGVFGARWYGKGIDGFAVHPALVDYVGGDGAKKYVVGSIRSPNPDGHVLVRLRLCRIKGHQRSDLPDNEP
jgi:endonuclease/exonuclease/phosphatase family metal-dependent hydrolase